ncbi:MOSC domain-containing protein [Sulfitobacter guttiformis]|uniref:MOSC domain-containing protein n=1 Tax=Sulfitobacter guttiformis TaxID=74349 RepID=A0A420DQF8_9RHOB|nr:MOSC N-terminal beta barrel domain-containing protein [Sulfitobacter guttiformis]KIN73829.1 MOSC domain protein [Sulfitobacter guttiformis KCTC 32187]RKE96462.1 hypothetical protein C8N30_1022 [Sulfitobacter guttiformis]
MIEVAALWRHPIKSHGREALERVTLLAGKTMPWDRFWAVTHSATKFDPRTARWMPCGNFMLGARVPALAAIWASLDEESRSITLRHQALDDLQFCPDDPVGIAEFLAWIAPLCPEGRNRPHSIVSAEGRGMTDSAFPSISIMSMASHSAVADALGVDLKTARWRGNIWLAGLPAWEEHNWMDRDIRIGKAILRVRERIKRCTVTNTNPTTGLRDTDTLATLKSVFGHQDFGVYAEVIETGEISLGAKAELV